MHPLLSQNFSDGQMDKEKSKCPPFKSGGIKIPMHTEVTEVDMKICLNGHDHIHTLNSHCDYSDELALAVK